MSETIFEVVKRFNGQIAIMDTSEDSVVMVLDFKIPATDRMRYDMGKLLLSYWCDYLNGKAAVDTLEGGEVP